MPFYSPGPPPRRLHISRPERLVKLYVLSGTPGIRLDITIARPRNPRRDSPRSPSTMHLPTSLRPKRLSSWIFRDAVTNGPALAERASRVTPLLVESPLTIPDLTALRSGRATQSLWWVLEGLALGI